MGNGLVVEEKLEDGMWKMEGGFWLLARGWNVEDGR